MTPALVGSLWVVALVQKKGHRRQFLSSRSGIQSIRGFSSQDFELLVGAALRRDGYTVEERGESRADGSLDLIERSHGATMLVPRKHRRS